MSPHRGIEPLLASQMKSFFFCCFLSFCFFPSSCTAGDSTEYTACAPRSCNGIPIDYPFSLSSTPSTSCGFPGLNLTCQGDEANARPFLVTRTGLKFIVNSINYRTQTIKLVIDPSTIMVSKCPHPLTNITLFNITNGGRLPLNFATDYGPVTFFYGCSAKPSAAGRLDSDLGIHIPGYNFTSNLVLGCSISEANFYTYAFSNEDNLYEAYNWLSNCKATLSFPVLASSFSGGARDMATSLFINEFDLVWAVDSMGICAACTASGGRCGYNITSGYFLCFCKQESIYGNCSRLATAIGSFLSAYVLFVIRSLWVSRSRRPPTENGCFQLHAPAKVEKVLLEYKTLTATRFTYNEITKMTKKFKYKLGQGGFGTVFQGWLSNGSPLAVTLNGKFI